MSNSKTTSPAESITNGSTEPPHCTEHLQITLLPHVNMTTNYLDYVHFSRALKALIELPGVIGYRWGYRVEKPQEISWLIDWTSRDAHIRFMHEPSYRPLVHNTLDGFVFSLDMYHIEHDIPQPPPTIRPPSGLAPRHGYLPATFLTSSTELIVTRLTTTPGKNLKATVATWFVKWQHRLLSQPLYNPHTHITGIRGGWVHEEIELFEIVVGIHRDERGGKSWPWRIQGGQQIGLVERITKARDDAPGWNRGFPSRAATTKESIDKEWWEQDLDRLDWCVNKERWRVLLVDEYVVGDEAATDEVLADADDVDNEVGGVGLA